MGCVGSKEDLDYDTLSKAVIEEEKRKIQQRQQQQQQQQQQQHPKDALRTLSPYQPEVVATTTNIPKHTLEPNGTTRPTPAVPEARGKEEQAPQPERKSPLPVAADKKVPTPTPRKQRRGFAHHLRNVFARSFDDDQVSSFLAPYFDKSDADAEFLREAMSKNFLFSNLSERQWKTMIDAFEQVEYERGVEVVKQGEEEDHFFVVREGYLHFQIDGVKGDKLGPGECFGELALLYDSPRTASVISDFPSVLFRVDQKTFRYILQTQRELAEHDKKVLLAGVAFLKDLDDTDLSRLAEAMVPRRFAVGELLATKGDPADTFFIIQEGKVRVTDFDAGQTKYQDHDLGPGDYFGETAMIKDEQRMANFRGKSKGIAISIDKSRFQELIGDFAELIHRSQDKKKLAAIELIQKTYLTGASLARLASRIVDQIYFPHTEIAKEGTNTPAALYLVREGRVEFTRTDGRGHRIVEEGGYFGEDTLMADWDLTGDEMKGIMDNAPTVRSKFSISSMDSVTILGVLTLEECRFVIDTTMIGKGRRTDFTSIVDEDIPLKSLKKHGMLGMGSFGEVWLASKVAPDGTTRPYALKIQSKYELIERKQAKGVVRERNILAQLKSPFLLRLVQTYQDAYFVYMLLGLVQGGELFDMIYTDKRHGMHEADAKFYAAGILEGLAYMHRRQIVYRDLKPENVLIAYGGYPVIIDLGFAKIVENKTYTPCGTPLYLAPEIMLNQGHTISADHWSFGILLFEMIAGRTPFYIKNMDRLTLCSLVIKGDFEFPKNKFSENAQDFIKKVLNVDPRKRLGSLAGGLDDLFRHRWFSSIDFAALRRREIEAPWTPTIRDPLDKSQFKKCDGVAPKHNKRYPALTPQAQEIFKDF